MRVMVREPFPLKILDMYKPKVGTTNRKTNMNVTNTVEVDYNEVGYNEFRI